MRSSRTCCAPRSWSPSASWRREWRTRSARRSASCAGAPNTCLRKLGADHPQAIGVADIVEQIDHVTRTIRQLLDFSRVSPAVVQPVSVNEALRDVSDLMRFEAERRQVAIDVEAADDLEPASADPDQLRQVLVNLTKNALDASAPASHVILRARRDGEDLMHARVRIDIEDHGCGIPAASLHRIFDPFFTTKKRGHGTGLGLAITAQIVAQSRSRDPCRQRRGPRQPHLRACGRRQRARSAALMADSRPRILVVDDNPKMVSLLVDELDDAGYAVETATGGEAAIARLREQPFDLVVTDLRMERVDGLDVLKAARALDDALPVMIMTAFGAVESAVEAIRAGAYHYFTKPFKIEEVLVFVGRAVADRRLRDENRALRKVAVERNGFASMVGRSDAMRRLYDAIERVAPSPATVLVRGESGTGKELVARALHFAGPRREGAVRRHQLHGAARAAARERAVRPRRAAPSPARHRCGAACSSKPTAAPCSSTRSATCPPACSRSCCASSKTARCGPSAPMRRARSTCASSPRPTRIWSSAFATAASAPTCSIGSTSCSSRCRRCATASTTFRCCSTHFLAKARARNPASRVTTLGPDVVRLLSRCPWPGNVRELENVVERLVILSSGAEVELADVEAHAPFLLEDGSPLARAKSELMPLKQLEREYMAWVVAKCGGNKVKAAEILQIDLSTIYRRGKGSQ